MGTASPKRKGGGPASKAKVVEAALPGRSTAGTQLPADNTSAAGTGFAARAGPLDNKARQDAEGRQSTQPALSVQAKMPQQAAAGRQNMQPGQGLVMSRSAGGGVAHSSRHGASPDADASLTLGSMLEASPSAGVTVAGGSVPGASVAFSSTLSARPHGGTPSTADPAAAVANSLPIPMSTSSVRCRSCPLPDTLTQAVLQHNEAAGVSVCLPSPSPPCYGCWKVGAGVAGFLLDAFHVNSHQQGVWALIMLCPPKNIRALFVPLAH